MIDHTNRRKVLKSLSVIGTAGITGCIGGSNNENGGNGSSISATLAATYESGNIMVEMANEFADRIADETDDNFNIEVTPGGAYGGEEDQADRIREGSLEFASASTAAWARHVSNYYIFNVPFSIQDYDHLIRIMESDFMLEGREVLRQEANQRMCSNEAVWMNRGLRGYTANEPVTHPDDVQDHSLRLPQFDEWIAVWEAIGANPVAVSLDELYTSLQTGNADASEGPPTQIASFNLYEVQSHFSLSEHHVAPGTIYGAEDFIQGLDQTYQDLIMETGTDVIQEAQERSVENEQEIIDTLSEEGMEIIPTEDIDRDAFFERAEPAARELFEDFEVSYEEVQNM